MPGEFRGVQVRVIEIRLIFQHLSGACNVGDPTVVNFDHFDPDNGKKGRVPILILWARGFF